MIGEFKKSKDKVFSSYRKEKNEKTVLKLTEKKDLRVVTQMSRHLKVVIVNQNILS